MRIVSRRIRESLNPRSVGANSIQLVVAVALAAEHDPISAWRPRGEGVGVRASLELPAFARRGIDDVEIASGAVGDAVHDLFSIRRPARHSGIYRVRCQGGEAGSIDADSPQLRGFDLRALEKSADAEHD